MCLCHGQNQWSVADMTFIKVLGMSSLLVDHVKWGIQFRWLGKYSCYQANRICVMDSSNFGGCCVDLFSEMWILSPYFFMYAMSFPVNYVRYWYILRFWEKKFVWHSINQNITFDWMLKSVILENLKINLKYSQNVCIYACIYIYIHLPKKYSILDISAMCWS